MSTRDFPDDTAMSSDFSLLWQRQWHSKPAQEPTYTADRWK